MTDTLVIELEVSPHLVALELDAFLTPLGVDADRIAAAMGTSDRVLVVPELNAATSWAGITNRPAMVVGSLAGEPTDMILWKGSQAQYDAIAVKDPATFYVIVE
jgi:hypothetical protein